jgi:hypothetical protein
MRDSGFDTEEVAHLILQGLSPMQKIRILKIQKKNLN